MPKSEVFCMDCLEAMRKMPDNFFDVACVDPPYGDACSQYVNVERERERERERKVEPVRPALRQVQGNSGSASTAGAGTARTRGTSTSGTARCYVNRGGGTVRTNTTPVSRTGGTWAEKYGKKSLRGTWPQEKNTSMNFFASHAIK